MAEVSPSVSLSKSNLSNGNGFSSKHIYDDIFSSPVKLKSSSCAFALDDYAEIFSRSTASLPSSIPVLDLLVVGEEDDDLVRVRSSRVDYSGILGDSVGQDEITLNSDDFSLRDSKRVKIPDKTSRSLTAQMAHSRGSELHDRIDTNQMSNLSSPLSSDNVNYENVTSPLSSGNVKYENVSHQRSSTMNKEGRKETRVAAKVYDVPQLSSMFDEAAPSKKNIPADSVELIVDDATISMDFGKGKKQRKHSQKVTHDFPSDEKPIQHDSRHERENSDSGFYAVDNSKNTFEASVEAKPPTTVPTPVSPKSVVADSDVKIASVSICKVYENHIHTGWANGDSSPSSPTRSEELDINSDAALCAAAVKRAIEEAEAHIRLAKEMLEASDSHGSMKMTFKNSLKFGRRIDNKHSSQANGFKESDLPEAGARVDITVGSDGLKDQRPKEVEQDGFDFEDQIKVPRDGETRNVTNTDKSKYSQESHSTSTEGGGEWEAGKHLSQLITGVKNRLVSFMSWQTDGENKVMQLQATIASDSLCQSQHCDKVVNDMNFTQRKESSGDRETVFKDGKGVGDTNLMASVPAVCEVEANVLPQETIYRGFKVWPDPENYMKLTDPAGSEEKAKGTDVEDSFMHNYDRREQEEFDDADREIVEEVVEQNQEKNNDSEMQEYEGSAIDTEHSILHGKILEHAKYMVDHGMEEATEDTANDESLNNILRNDGPDKTMTDSYGGGLNIDVEGIEDGEEYVQEVVLGHQEHSELLDKAYMVQTIMKEVGPVGEHKWDENDDTERQNDKAAAEEKQNVTETYSVEKIRAAGKEDACVLEENEEIRRHNDQTLCQQYLEFTNFVTENYLMPETGVEEGTESVSIWLKNETIGRETDTSVAHQLEDDRKVEDEGNSEGEVDVAEATEDADKQDKNPVSRQMVQKAAEQQKIAVVQTVASLVEEIGELGGVEDAYKWEEIADIGQCSPVTDQSNDTTMQIEATQEGVNNEHQAAADHNPEQEERVLSRGEAHQQDETGQS